MTKLLLALLLVATAAQAKPSDEEVLRQGLQKMRAEVQQITQAKFFDCHWSGGTAHFCSCLADKLPFAWSYMDYVAIMTRTREENHFDSLAPELQAQYLRVPSIRNQCVAAK